jgi:predicted nucleotidyltransferase
MLPHHQAAVARVTAYLADQTEVPGLLLGGSVAHGFARPNSDIDILIIVTPEAYTQGEAHKHHNRYL